MNIDCFLKESYTKNFLERSLTITKITDIMPMIDLDRFPIDTRIELKRKLSRMAHTLFLKFKNPVLVDGISLEIVHKQYYPGATYDFVSKFLTPFDFALMAEDKIVIYRYAIVFYDGKKYYNTETYDVGTIMATHKNNKPRDIIHFFYPFLQKNAIKKPLIEDKEHLTKFILSAIKRMIKKLKDWELMKYTKLKYSPRPCLPKTKIHKPYKYHNLKLPVTKYPKNKAKEKESKHRPPRWEHKVSTGQAVISAAREELGYFKNNSKQGKRYYGKLPQLK